MVTKTAGRSEQSTLKVTQPNGCLSFTAAKFAILEK